MLAAGLLLLAAGTSWAVRRGASVLYKLHGVDIYGSSDVTAEQILKKYETDLKKMLEQKSRGKSVQGVEKKVHQMHRAIERGVKAMGRFGYARMDLIEVSETEGSTRLLAMFEVVEKKDLKRRMPFRPKPRKKIADKSGLLDDWERYEELGARLIRDGEVDIEVGACGAFYCKWGTPTAELKAFEDRFSEKVPDYRKLFDQIYKKDRDPDRRARALYLLSYVRDGEWLVDECAHGLTDPAVEVREAAMNIINNISIFHEDIELPVKRIWPLLDYPFADDRDRALALAVNVATNKDYSTSILIDAADDILGLLRSKHPDNREGAHTVLQVMSNEEYDVHAYEAWEAWVLRARRAKIDGE